MVILALCIGVFGCASKDTQCGGTVSPAALAASAPGIVASVKADSRAFCSGAPSGCDFRLKKADKGWSVAATYLLAYDGKCLYRNGAERFYVYDEQGALVRVIPGI
jgi:hypothetical protein